MTELEKIVEDDLWCPEGKECNKHDTVGMVVHDFLKGSTMHNHRPPKTPDELVEYYAELTIAQAFFFCHCSGPIYKHNIKRDLTNAMKEYALAVVGENEWSADYNTGKSNLSIEQRERNKFKDEIRARINE